MRAFVLLSFLFALSANAAEPQFSNFPATSFFHGVPARIDFSSSPSLRLFRTALRRGAARGPNYAGHLTVVVMGCGSNCEGIEIISARTGKILDGVQSCGGVDYKLNSTLLILNPSGHDAVYPAGCKTEFYKWDGRRLKLVGSRPTSG